MISIEFNINKYDWKVYLYLSVDECDAEFIFSKLSELNCDYSKAKTAYKVLSNDYINKGFTYTNYNAHISLIIVCKAENKGQYINTIVHEINHLKSHIATAYNLDEKEEEVSYLIGDIAEVIYNEYHKIT